MTMMRRFGTMHNVVQSKIEMQDLRKQSLQHWLQQIHFRTCDYLMMMKTALLVLYVCGIL